MTAWYVFPPDVAHDTADAHHDTAGWTIVAHPGQRPSDGAACLVFEIPDGTPDWNGCWLTVRNAQRQPLYQLHGALSLKTPLGAGLFVDVYPDPPSTGVPASAFLPVTIDGDHFVAGGARWTWRQMSGFCDYKLFLDGGDLRSLLKQSQDLNCHGRRMFPNMVNIVNFDPASYGQAYWDRIPEYLALNADYEQYVNIPVLADSQYRGWSLAQCQNFWARWNDACQPYWNKFISLTNEFDHGGNLVGQPNDYARPGDQTVSQGSAVQDKTPPCPKEGTGAGWGIWEWHAADLPTKFDHEYYIWQGLSTGAVKPCVISEHGRRINEGNLDLDYVRSLTYASLANGCGLTMHTEDGKYSRLLGPNQAQAVQTAMSILAVAQ